MHFCFFFISLHHFFTHLSMTRQHKYPSFFVDNVKNAKFAPESEYILGIEEQTSV